MKAIEDVMLFPKRPEAVDAVADVSRQFAAWSTANNREFSYLLDMSAHDYYTVVHMVDVAVGCGLLIRKLCPGEDALQATVIQGGMLHDIGKRGVPEEILNKAGPLDPEEWQVIKQHPLMGYHELLANATVPPLVLEMVRDHHERPDGKGYANGLADESLGRAARVCAVVDVFDAICAARPYRGPTPPAETLRIMREGSGTQFDREVLQAWIGLVEQMIQEDPERAPSTVEAPPQSTLSHFMAEAPSPASSSDVPYSERLGWEERREHPRFLCNKIVKVGFLRRGKPYPVKPGQWLELRVTDVSRGGVELQTPWPLTLNDVLDIELPLSESWKVRRNARVVRVRKRKDRQWMAGLAFVATG
jgi:hypothetical protein